MMPVAPKSMKGKSIKFAVMTIQEAAAMLAHELTSIYDPREASNIADWVMEHLTGWKKIDRVVRRNERLTDQATSTLQKYREELLAHRPVQYVLGQAWFYGMELFVDERVLIPRPETEELVGWILDEHRGNRPMAVLDVGTGSGCIAIALKKKLSSAVISACDISTGALEVARQNAAGLGVKVVFFTADILDATAWHTIPSQDVIVSNPPYIPWNERPGMHRNVADHEPAMALFVDSNDPLIFYRSIAELGKVRLNAGGKIYVEIHENLAQSASEVFEASGYRSVEVRRDMQGKQRMIAATGL